VVSLGTLPPYGRGTALIELEPPDGVSNPEVPVTVHVASGARAVHSQRLLLRIAPRMPELEIEVSRPSPELASFALHNRGETATGELLIAVPGATRALPQLAPGESSTIELPLSEKPLVAAITLFGPNVQRRIEVPLGDSPLRVLPPEVEVEISSFLGRRRLRVEAHAVEGLQRAWIEVDEKKLAYADFGGRHSAELHVRLEEGEHGVQTKVETVSGVAVYDLRRVTVD
jgi:hypothetical protein